MDEKEILHQQSLVTDSFSTIERLEGEMASITRDFESLDNLSDAQSDSESQVEENIEANSGIIDDDSV